MRYAWITHIYDEEEMCMREVEISDPETLAYLEPCRVLGHTKVWHNDRLYQWLER
jgi:hypothetical protein